VPGRRFRYERGNVALPITKTSRTSKTSADFAARALKPPRHFRWDCRPNAVFAYTFPLSNSRTRQRPASLGHRCARAHQNRSRQPRVSTHETENRRESKTSSAPKTLHSAGERNLKNSKSHLRGLRAEAFPELKLPIGPHCLRGPPSQTKTSETPQRCYTAAASRRRPHNVLPLCRSTRPRQGTPTGALPQRGQSSGRRAMAWRPKAVDYQSAVGTNGGLGESQ